MICSVSTMLCSIAISINLFCSCILVGGHRGSVLVSFTMSCSRKILSLPWVWITWQQLPQQLPSNLHWPSHSHCCQQSNTKQVAQTMTGEVSFLSFSVLPFNNVITHHMMHPAPSLSLPRPYVTTASLCLQVAISHVSGHGWCHTNSNGDNTSKSDTNGNDAAYHWCTYFYNTIYLL